MTKRNLLAAPAAGADTPAPPAGPGDASGMGGSGGDGPQGWGATATTPARLRVDPDPERDRVCARLPLTDMGNAERWRVRHGQDFRFCAEIGWFAWEGNRWRLLSEERDSVPADLVWSIARTVRAIRNEAALIAASGYEPVLGMSDKERLQLEAWADAHGTTSHELYLNALVRADAASEAPKGEEYWGDWLAALEPMDQVLGKKLHSQTVAAHAKASESAGVVKKVVGWIKGMPDVVIRHDQMDTDRLAINVLNGTLRLVRARVKRSAEEVAAGKSEWKTDGWSIKKFPHSRDDLITKLAPVKYAPSAACPAYDAFIERVMPDVHMRRFIHQWGGYSLTGDIGEHKLAFFHGGGRNGKGTWVEAVAAISGDYAGSIGIESLSEQQGSRRGDQATPDIARLPGVRFLRVSEPKKGMAWNDGLIKQLTGGDPVDARHLNKGFFTFLPSFKLTISGNNKPKVRDLTHGMWARMQLVPWTVTIPDAEIDRSLGDKLLAEGPGILNRLLEGLLDWRTNGLIVPDQVRNATSAYRHSSDDLGRFLSEICEVGPECRVGARMLHELYTAWAEVSGGSPWGMKTFKASMEDKGFEQKQSDGMKWLGVRPVAGVDLEDVKRGLWPGKAGDGGGVSPDPLGDLDDVPGWEDDR